jgi:2-polyprenyl-3-methyl-5-hydroxy-6-metoxy-1,4-benzoquinol methylase
MSPDPDLLKQYSFQLFSKFEGAVTAGMVHLGDALGLFGALKDAPHSLSSSELAAAVGLHERWVREWAYNQAAAKMILCDEDERFSLSPEAAAVLATPEHPAFGMGMFHRLPQTMAVLQEMPEIFRSGIGRDYDSHGCAGAVGIERSFEPWSNAFLVPAVLPLLDGLLDRLDRGATVVDIGCGAGGAVLLMAGRFPQSSFTGYDISKFALQRAAEKLEASGVSNARFADPREHPLSTGHDIDFITTFDCLHDMTHPQQMMHSIRDAIAEDGVWLLVDIKARDTFQENVAKNPMAALMYGISVLSCMSSAMSAPDGAGLGTLGLSESTAQQMASTAGFSRFRRLGVDHAINAFYEIRP